METRSLVSKDTTIKKSYGISLKNKYIPIVSKFDINDNDDDNIISATKFDNTSNIDSNVIVKFTQRYQPYILTVYFIHYYYSSTIINHYIIAISLHL